MHKLTALAISAALIGILAAGCTSAQPKEYRDPDQTIETGVNQQFIVALEANPTTGYGWYANFDSGFLKQVGSKYVAGEAETGKVGGGGEQTFTFQGLKTGTTEITLTYKRTWEGEPADHKTFTVNIK